MYFKKPKFWKTTNFLSILLLPFSLITLIISEFKNFLPKKNFKIKTICVGNITVGGTGKTSLCITINDILKKSLKTVFIKKFYLEQIDEQKLLKSKGYLICKNSRIISLKTAQKNGCDVAIMDDGLQQKNIKKNISIACFNSSETIGNRFLIPSGPLRERLYSIKNVNAVILNGEKRNLEFEAELKKINNKLKFFYGKYEPTNLNKFDRKKKYLVFSGLGNPEEFERTLKKNKFNIKKNIVFPDHYNYKKKDIVKINKVAKTQKLNIITTEKDYLRINKKFRKNIFFLKVNLKISDTKYFSNFLLENL